MTPSGTLAFFVNYPSVSHSRAFAQWRFCYRIAGSGVHMGNDVSSWCGQVNGLTQGSVLSSTLFNLYTNDLPVTLSRIFIYADDICYAFQAENVSEIECTLTTDLAHLAKYCQQHVQFRESVFHLHDIRSCRELDVQMNGQQLRHDPYPVYLGVTLDGTMSYREQLTCTAAKLKRHNNLITKLAGMSRGAYASTLRTSALALCYSVAEYCCPAWARSSYILNFTVPCTLFQAAWIPARSHGSRSSLMCLHLHFAAKQHATRCFR